MRRLPTRRREKYPLFPVLPVPRTALIGRRSRLVIWMVAAIVIAGAAIAVAWLLLAELPARLSNASGLSVAERVASQDAIRGTLVQSIGGLFLAGGLFFTARTFVVTRQSHITERYAAAIEQLGHASIYVRIGGIYALERIARDSQRDVSTITAVLCSFVRLAEGATPEGGPPGDIVAALEIVSSLPGSDRPRPLNLKGAHLDGLHLGRAKLAGADLSNCRLVLAQLPGVDLRGANLRFANLSRASLHRADLRGATLTPDADLSDSSCVEVDFREAVLNGARLERSTLVGSDLRDAHLEGANLTSARLEGGPRLVRTKGAHFSAAIFSKTAVRGVDFSRALELTGFQRSAAADDEATRWPRHIV